jgi:hypothetical protein
MEKLKKMDEYKSQSYVSNNRIGTSRSDFPRMIGKLVHPNDRTY